ncbi:MAG: hypothetical protein QNJ18_18415 [Xenococcaceae cyanobacterium MO_167.B52]|nr:hypothetical protein [Xenococcaceae cyanobacterium MO_167.B52]
MWAESGESLAPLSSPSSPPSPSSEGRSSLSLSQQTIFLTEQSCSLILSKNKRLSILTTSNFEHQKFQDLTDDTKSAYQSILLV